MGETRKWSGSHQGGRRHRRAAMVTGDAQLWSRIQAKQEIQLAGDLSFCYRGIRQERLAECLGHAPVGDLNFLTETAGT